MAEKIVVEFDVLDNGSDDIAKINSELSKTATSGAMADRSTRSLTASHTELRSMALNVFDVFNKIKWIYDETVNSTINLSNTVRQFRDVTGQSAEESSRLVQVLDDYKINIGAAEQATKKLVKEGLEFNIQTLAKLSDEYLSLNTNAEKTQFLYEKFGKSGDQFAEIMLQGSDAILAANDAISENLILTDKALQQSREYEKNVDDLTDTLLAYKVAAGNEVIPTVNTLFDLHKKTFELIDSGEQTYTRAALYQAALNIEMENSAQAARDADAARWNGLASLYATNDALIEGADAAEDNTEANKEFLSTLGSVQSSEEKYHDTASKLAEERVKLEDEKNKLLSQGYWEQSEKIQEINDKLDENSQKAQENADEHDLANRRIILGLLERKLTQDGILDDTELQWLLEKGEAWGVYSQTVVDETTRAINEANALINGLVTEKTFTLTLNTIYSDSSANSNQGAQTVGQVGKGRRRASGGSVLAGQSYMVGERGMEMFVPQTNGVIVPNQQLKADNSELISAINASRVDERSLARSIVTAMMKAGA